MLSSHLYYLDAKIQLFILLFGRKVKQKHLYFTFGGKSKINRHAMLLFKIMLFQTASIWGAAFRQG